MKIVNCYKCLLHYTLLLLFYLLGWEYDKINLRLHFYFDVDAFYKRQEVVSETATNFFNSINKDVIDVEVSNKQLPRLKKRKINNLSNYNFKRNIKK